MLAAHRAIRIFAQLQLAKLHGQRIEQQQATDKAVAAPQNQLDRLHGLNRADDPRQYAEHAALRARRDEPRRRRLGIQAAVARPFRHAEHGYLPFEAKNRAVHIRLAEQNASVVDEIARRKIVRAVDNQIEVLEQLQGVIAGQLGLKCLDLDVRIEACQSIACRFRFRFAHIIRTKRHLPLQVREVHHIEVHETKPAHTGGRQIQTEWRAQPTRTDQQDLGTL